MNASRLTRRLIVRQQLGLALIAAFCIGVSHSQDGVPPTPAPTPAPASPATTTATTETEPKQFAFLPNLPATVKATYKVMRGGLSIGTVEEKFERLGARGDQYRITSETRAEGAIAIFVRDQLTYVSSGRITAAGLVPTTFTSTRKTSPQRNFTSRFDWMKNEIVREHKVDGRVERDTYELTAGTQDRLSVMYQFMVANPRNTSITALMTQGREAEQYLYVKRGEPKISTQAGDFETVHYARDAKPGESKAELWLAKSKNFLPVRVIFTDTKGTSLEQTLVELTVQ
jgi:hypothetical protein